MRPALEDIALIEAYINKQLTPDERQAFEQRLEKDADLKQATKDFQLLFPLLEKGFRAQNLAYLKALDAELPEPKLLQVKKGTAWKRWLGLGLAASLIAVLIAFATIYNNPKPPFDVVAQVDTYFEPYPNITTSRSIDSTLKKAYEAGLEAYTKEQYELALKYWQQVPDSAISWQQWRYMGNAYLALRPSYATQAIEALQQAQAQESVQNGITQWYLALAYVNNKEPEKAEPILQAIINNPDTDRAYAQKAQKLLNAMLNL